MPRADRDEITRKVQEVLVEALRLERPPRLADRLIEDLGAESVDLITLVFELEESLGQEIRDEDIPRLTTVAAIVDLLAGEPDGNAGGP